MFYLYFDGGSRGNPGTAGSAAVLYDKEMREVANIYHFCGDNATNNHAEYTGLIKGVELINRLGISYKDVVIRGDSQLCVKQCKGEWKVKNENLKTIYDSLLRLLQDNTGRPATKISDYFLDIQHVLRNNNKRADELCNLAMDTKTDKIRMLC
jgi:ribonuclease HI